MLPVTVLRLTVTRAEVPPLVVLAEIPTVQSVITERRTCVAPSKTLMPLASSLGLRQSRTMQSSTVIVEPSVSIPSSSPEAMTHPASLMV